MKKVMSLILLTVGIIILYFGFHNALQVSSQKDQERVRQTITALVLKCYSIEGSYPKTIEYLKTHYGLLVNDDDYRVVYHYEGSNLTPQIDVYKKEKHYENAR